MMAGIIRAVTIRAQGRFIRPGWLLLALTLTPPASAQDPVILVPNGGTAEQCVAQETLAAAVRMNRGLRLLRAPLLPEESLDAARRRLGADRAVSGDHGALGWTLTWADETSPRIALTSPREELDLGALLPKLWRGSGAPKEINPAFAAGSPRALAFACKKESSAAFLEAGPAVGEALRELTDPSFDPRARPGTAPLLVEWARGMAALRQKNRAYALVSLQRVFDRLRAGERAPLWRRGTDGASAVSVIGDLAVTFSRGVFEARGLADGHPVFRVQTGKAEPALIPAGDGVLIATADKELIAVTAATGKIAWRLAAPGVWPEVVPVGEQLIFATADSLGSVGRSNGKVAWQVPLLEEATAGPALSGNVLVVPGGTGLLIHDASSGQLVGRVQLGDEVSAPLWVEQSGAIWALVGADRLAKVVLAPAAEREREVQGSALRGLKWPPIELGPGLYFAAGSTRRGTWITRAEQPPKPLFRGALTPIVALPEGAGLVAAENRGMGLVALSPEGRPLWRAKLDRAVVSLSAASSALWVAAGSQVVVLDPKTGKTRASFALGEAVRALAVGSAGGVALTDGALLGLPGDEDPRPEAWAPILERQLAELHQASGQAVVAEKLARALIQRGSAEVEGFAVAARILRSRDPAASAGAWLRVLSRAHSNEPLAQEARAELEAQAGLRQVLELGGPASAVVTSSIGLVAVQANGLVRIVDPAGSVAWSRPGSSVTRAGMAFFVDGRWYDARMGRELAKQAPLPGHATALGLIHLEQGAATATLSVGPPGQPPGWRVVVPGVGLRIVDVRPPWITLEAAGPTHSVIFIDAATKELGKGAPVPGPVEVGRLTGSRLLAVSGHSLLALDAQTGQVVARLKLPGLSGARLIGHENGGLLANGKTLIALDQSLKVRWRAALPAQISEIAVAEGSDAIFLALDDGSLTAFQLSNGRKRGRLFAGPVAAMGASGGAVFVAPASAGVLWVLDAARSIEPSPRRGTVP